MAHRRLAVISSHLLPVGIPSSPPLQCSVSPAIASDGRTAHGRCVFCEIIRGESPAFKLYEDDICLCILDSNPLSHGHALIIPKSHFRSLEVTPPSVVAAMCSTVPFLSIAIMKATSCDAFNLVVNNGKAAGQVIFHTHFHIIPRRAGDKLWPSEVLLPTPELYMQLAKYIVKIDTSLETHTLKYEECRGFSSFRRRPIEQNEKTFSLVSCIRDQLAYSSGNYRADESQSMLQKNSED